MPLSFNQPYPVLPFFSRPSQRAPSPGEQSKRALTRNAKPADRARAELPQQLARAALADRKALVLEFLVKLSRADGRPTPSTSFTWGAMRVFQAQGNQNLRNLQRENAKPQNRRQHARFSEC